MVGKRFQGKTALITGGSRGIGRAIALRLAQEGAGIVVNYVSNREAAEEVRALVEAEGGSCEAIQADVADLAAVRRMVERALQQHGRIDVLVNNAAIVHHGSLLSYSDSDLEREFGEMWRVNVQGATHCTRAVMASMMSRKAGSIVNVASIAGYGNTSGGTTFYGATKAALIRLTKRFAFELGPYNINVNAVAPGLVRTDILTRGKTPEEIESRVKDFASRSVLGRIGEPADIAAVVAFLASPDASFVTGQVLTADGGRTDYLSFSG